MSQKQFHSVSCLYHKLYFMGQEKPCNMRPFAVCCGLWQSMAVLLHGVALFGFF